MSNVQLRDNKITLPIDSKKANTLEMCLISFLIYYDNNILTYIFKNKFVQSDGV